MPHRRRLLLLTIIFLSATFIPHALQAQVLDARCWTEADCVRARQDHGITDEKEAKDGFVQNVESKSVCGNTSPANKNTPSGFCLPSTKTITEISFGGKREFADLGEFLQLIYRYGIIVAGILAVVMIIVAGLQLTTSGGSADRVTAAKKRLGGAIAGLLIALLSFVLLNALNPYLVNLRLPQTWLIRTQETHPVYCDPKDTNSTFEKIEPKGAQLTADQRKAKSTAKESKFETASKDTECGFYYLMKRNNEVTCRGLVCKDPSKKICAPPENAARQTADSMYDCRAGVIGGKIAAAGNLICSDLETKTVDDLELYAMCKDGRVKKVGSNNVSDTAAGYTLSAAADLKTACGSETKLSGFFIAAEVNDEGGLAGNLCPGGTLSGGKDDWFAIGQRAPGSHRCDMNLSKIAYGVDTGFSPPCKLNECTCGIITKNKALSEKLANDQKFSKHLISLAELENGYLCDIFISRSEFPAADQVSAGKIVGGATAGALVGSAILPGIGSVKGALIGVAVSTLGGGTACSEVN